MIARLSNKWRRFAISRWARREFTLPAAAPYVSFTFDDFPTTAYTVGGRILVDHGVRGTYFTSSALLGGPSPSGPIAEPGLLAHVIGDGHEVGCHTREHLDGTRESPDAFRRSIEANQVRIQQLAAGAQLDVFAYPLEGPTLAVKRAVGPRFLACRGGGQTFNAGTIDLNLASSFFLDWKSRDGLTAIDRLIEQNVAQRGWLIFSTHDVADPPSRYGCTPSCFEHVVRRAVDSGARVLPMAQACAELGIRRTESRLEP